MKKFAIIILVLLGFAIALPLNVFAQDATQDPEPGENPDVQNIEMLAVTQFSETEATVTFETLGYEDEILAGPFETARYFFTPPSNWNLVDGSRVVINYDVFGSAVDTSIEGEQFLGILAVSFNGQIVENIGISKLGSASVSLTFPPGLLPSPYGRQELELVFMAERDCDDDIETNLVIKSNSYFYLPFEIVPIQPNLTSLPAPFYLRDALLPDKTIIVVPDKPDNIELQAALNVASGLGASTASSFAFELLSSGQLTQEILTSNNLIFVGTVSDLSYLDEIPFTLSVNDGAFANLEPANTDDGIVQIAPSPWNEGKAVMLVSGTTPTAVNKAAQAVSSAKIFIFDDPALVYVADVQAHLVSAPVAESFTLEDIGYSNRSIADLGVSELDYDFWVTLGQVGTENAYIGLDYFHSGLLDYERSVFTVKLNGQVIAGQRLSEASVTPSSLHIEIPPGIMQHGENELSVTTGLLPASNCTAAVQDRFFFMVMDSTSFYIPAEDQAPKGSPLIVDLSEFPQLFLGRSDLGNTAYVLPQQHPVSWNVAAQIAYELGHRIKPTISNLTAFYGDAVPPGILSEKSLIAVGKASALPFVSEINDQLPAPFDLKTNTASEQGLQVIYRIPENVSVGYLQTLPSPFSSEQNILIVSGNNNQGVEMAGQALLTLTGKIHGDFVVTNGSQIATGSQFSPAIHGEGEKNIIVDEIAPGAETEIVTPFPEINMDSPTYESPAWLVPFIIVSIIVIVITLGYLLISNLRQRSSPRSYLSDN